MLAPILSLCSMPFVRQSLSRLTVDGWSYIQVRVGLRISDSEYENLNWRFRFAAQDLAPSLEDKFGLQAGDPCRDPSCRGFQRKVSAIELYSAGQDEVVLPVDSLEHDSTGVSTVEEEGVLATLDRSRRSGHDPLGLVAGIAQARLGLGCGPVLHTR